MFIYQFTSLLAFAYIPCFLRTHCNVKIFYKIDPLFSVFVKCCPSVDFVQLVHINFFSLVKIPHEIQL